MALLSLLRLIRSCLVDSNVSPNSKVSTSMRPGSWSALIRWISYLKKKKRQVVSVWPSDWDIRLGHFHSISQCLGSSLSRASDSSFLLTAPWGQQITDQEVESLRPVWDTWVEFLTSGFSLTSPSCCRHLGSRLTDVSFCISNK